MTATGNIILKRNRFVAGSSGMSEPEKIQMQQHSEDSTGLEFLNARAIGLILLVWIIGGASFAATWWYVPFDQKPLWALALLIWTLLSPLLLSFTSLVCSIILIVSGWPTLSERLCHLAVILFRIGWWPLSLAGLRVPSLMIDFYVLTLVGNCKFQKAESVAKASLMQKEQQCGTRGATLCHPLLTLAIVCSQLGKLSEAEAYLKRALSISKEQRGTLASITRSKLLHESGNLYRMALKFDQAETSYLNAIDESRTLGLDRQDGLFLALGEIYTITDRLSKAESSLEKARTGQNKFCSKAIVMCWRWRWLRKMGVLRIKQGRLVEADELISEAVRITKKRASGLPTENIETLKVSALLEAAKQNLELSDSLYRQALSLAEHVYGSSHPVTADILYQYANLLLKKSKNEESLQLKSRADAIKDRVWTELATTCNNDIFLLESDR